MYMQKEMLNINGNLIGEVQVKTIKGKDGEIAVANCNVYGEKTELTKDFKKGDFIHVYGYYKEVQKEDKSYKNFIVRHTNKIEKKENKED